MIKNRPTVEVVIPPPQFIHCFSFLATLNGVSILYVTLCRGCVCRYRCLCVCTYRCVSVCLCMYACPFYNGGGFKNSEKGKAVWRIWGWRDGTRPLADFSPKCTALSWWHKVGVILLPEETILTREILGIFTNKCTHLVWTVLLSVESFLMKSEGYGGKDLWKRKVLTLSLSATALGRIW